MTFLTEPRGSRWLRVTIDTGRRTPVPSENDPITAPFYNFGKGSQALYRQPQGQKQMAVSVRCVRERPLNIRASDIQS